MIVLRDWQAEALEKFENCTDHAFLLDATMGSGKTILSAFCFKSQLEANTADFVVAVAPLTNIKGDADSGYLGDYCKVGIEITTVLHDGKACPTEFRGAVITYNQLPNLITTFQTWKRNGVRLFVVFDEVHHLTETNVWGYAGERLADCAVQVLAITGTAFRGDGQRISFINYDETGRAIPHHTYSYKQAVTDGVCRPVEFVTDDGIAEFVRQQEEDIDRQKQRRVKISEAKTDDDLRGANATIMRGDSPWLEKFIARGEDRLDELRQRFLNNAGCLIVCRPGIDDKDTRHLRQISQLTRRVTGHEPVVVSHDDADANALIEHFRNSSEKFLCAVRKISEGVHIKRLMVLIMATRPTTELLFRQLCGRVMSVSKDGAEEYAVILIPKFPQLVEWAERIQEEAEAGLKERKVKTGTDGGMERDQKPFVALGSSHEDGGAIYFGDTFSAAEINAAERLKNETPQLFGIATSAIACVMRKAGVEVDPTKAPAKPLQVQKKELRRDINKLARRLAIRRNADEPDFKKVWTDLHKITGVRDVNDLMDNRNIEVMKQVLGLLKSWVGVSANVG